MHCPKCSSDDLKVLDTRAGKIASTRRRRECQGCGYRFSTIEEILREDLVVVKRDGRRESFDRTKLATGLRRAIAKRPIDAEQINDIMSGQPPRGTARPVQSQSYVATCRAPIPCQKAQSHLFCHRFS